MEHKVASKKGRVKNPSIKNLIWFKCGTNFSLMVLDQFHQGKIYNKWLITRWLDYGFTLMDEILMIFFYQGNFKAPKVQIKKTLNLNFKKSIFVKTNFDHYTPIKCNRWLKVFLREKKLSQKMIPQVHFFHKGRTYKR